MVKYANLKKKFASKIIFKTSRSYSPVKSYYILILKKANN